MKKNNYDLYFLNQGHGPSLTASTDANARRSAAALCRQIGWANSAGSLVRKTDKGPVTVATFKTAADL